MLDQYVQRTQLLLKDPSFEVFNDGDLTNYVNMARGQLAGQTECVRVLGTLAVTSSSQLYGFTSIQLGGLTSVQAVFSVNQITYAVGSGQKSLHSRSFPWFNTYILSQPAPTPGPPAVWCQYGPGVNSDLYVNVLDGAYTLSLDCSCQPSNLSTDADAESIPYPLTDAVPFFAAYFAALTMGDKDKASDMYDEYKKFVGSGKGIDRPSVLPGNFGPDGDPFSPNRLGIQPRGQQ